MCDLWKKDTDLVLEPNVDGLAFDCSGRAKELIANGKVVTRTAPPQLRTLQNLPDS
jgi:hypothetical protein